MAGRAKRLRLRCFLEGVEVPIIGVQIVGLPNSPLVASVQIPPAPEATRFLPRTLVHIYFLDFYEDESPFVSDQTSLSTSDKESNPSVYEKSLRNRLEETDAPDTDEDLEKDYLNDKYKLL